MEKTIKGIPMFKILKTLCGIILPLSVPRLVAKFAPELLQKPYDPRFTLCILAAQIASVIIMSVGDRSIPAKDLLRILFFPMVLVAAGGLVCGIYTGSEGIPIIMTFAPIAYIAISFTLYKNELASIK